MDSTDSSTRNADAESKVSSEPRILILASEWDDLRETVREARTFAMEARDSSRDNHQTLVQVVAPKLVLVDRHEADIQRGTGALWAFGVVGSILALGLAVLPFLVAR